MPQRIVNRVIQILEFDYDKGGILCSVLISDRSQNNKDWHDIWKCSVFFANATEITVQYLQLILARNQMNGVFI